MPEYAAPTGRGLVITDAAHYLRGVRQAGAPLALADAAALPRSGGSFVWIELFEPNDEELRALCEGFGSAHARPPRSAGSRLSPPSSSR